MTNSRQLDDDRFKVNRSWSISSFCRRISSQKSAIFLKITPEWALEPKQFCARHREPIHAGRLVVALAPEFG